MGGFCSTNLGPISRLLIRNNRICIREKIRGGWGLITVCPHPEDPVPTSNWILENQPIEPGILTQQSR